MRIAVIGAGISGLVAAWLLQREHEVYVFEANNYAGGHTRTVRVDGGGRNIDTGFIVFNEPDYPLFNRLLDSLNVERQPSNMSFSVHCEKTGLEYCAGKARHRLFAQWRNWIRPRFYRMLTDIVRFYREAPDLMQEASFDLTVDDYLHQANYSDMFRDQHLLPMASALWSAPLEGVKEFPAKALVEFMDQHSMLNLHQRPEWFAIKGGSSRYVEALCNDLHNPPKLNAKVQSVQRNENEVRIRTGDDEGEFDAAVMACHSDQALDLLDNPSAPERQILGAIRYFKSSMCLHTDTGLLPRRRGAWASWNYRVPAARRTGPLVTYHMNQLQNLTSSVDYCVTLNGEDLVDSDKILDSFEMAHPQFDAKALEAQQRLDEIQGNHGIYYCGAWTGYGFHEDGMRSAVGVADKLGVKW